MRGTNLPAMVQSARQLQQQGESERARGVCREILAQHPRQADALHVLGLIARQNGNFDRAAHWFGAAMEANPEVAVFCNDLGLTLQKLGRLNEAVAAFRKAGALQASFHEAWINLGNTLRDQEKFDASAAAYQKALAIAPESVLALSNLGVLLKKRGRLVEAMVLFDRAIQIQPDYAPAHWNKSSILLLTGDFENGWKEYEWRWRLEGIPQLQKRFSHPLWEGAELGGKTILLCTEQGFGDAIQMIRYAPQVAARGGNVVVACQPELLHLFESALGVNRVVARDEAGISADFQVPLMSLPGIFGTGTENIPAPIPYLSAHPDRIEAWREKIALDRRNLRVGLVWAGRPTHENDRYRSCSLAQFTALGKIPNVEFFSLQKGPRAEQSKLPPTGMPWMDLTENLTDFADTAALISHLDLVIAVDTAVVHLAGAMGKPAWMLLPDVPDWRWLLERENSPWYPTLRLFRQKELGEWDEVIQRVGEALGEFAAQHQATLQSGTDVNRWRNAAALEVSWNERAQRAADHIPAGATVLDLGCGAMALEKCLPQGCQYLPCDVVMRDARTVLSDFNRDEFPPAHTATHLTLLGVLEYLHEYRRALSRLHHYQLPLILSYNPANLTTGVDRASLGWVNHLTESELLTVIAEAGFTIRTRQQIDAFQVLLHLLPHASAPIPSKNVLVLSVLNTGNFGDRLGYHLIHEILPPWATVTHGFFNYRQKWKLENVPQEKFDLVILGLGNSIFQPMLTDELLQLLEHSPCAIGIFGTQYRQKIDAIRFERMLDRLHTWFARTQEDVLLWGKNRTNVQRLGDWLINAFPLTHGKNPEPLIIGTDIWKNLPLDRTIQRIQAHRRVFSPRIHPLLCALTSAESVAYREQKEDGSGESSGKFRSLLLDIFGRTYPEQKFFTVDRDAVARYKMQVAQRTTRLRQTVASLLE